MRRIEVEAFPLPPCKVLTVVILPPAFVHAASVGAPAPCLHIIAAAAPSVVATAVFVANAAPAVAQVAAASASVAAASAAFQLS